MKTIYYARKSSDLYQSEIEHASLARELAAEGMVLLENNGILPLKDRKIALFGVGARHTVYGGSGSGENNPRYIVSIMEGLNNNGFEITNNKWLDDYDTLYESEYRKYRSELAEGMKKVGRMEQMDYASSHPFFPPEKQPEAGFCETAIYVLSRSAGEGSDREEKKGDWLIRDEEFASLKQLCSLYKNVILLLNIPAMIDLSFLDELNVSAVVYIMTAGMETGNAVADILSGKVNPSGR